MSKSGRIGIILVFGWLLAAAGPASAQAVNPQDKAFAYSQGSALPAWVVPVLKLVSSTHVEPTTGIVLSGSGLVIVPADFASPGDEIIVLDGGTDILRNGRPARLEHGFPAAGLEVLHVEGLARTGAPFATTSLASGSPVQMVAFPPAELIAEGKPPLNISTRVEILPESGRPVLSTDTTLPNVTGALLDSCGNLAGLSLAADVQTMDPSPGTRYQWRDTLLGLLDEMGVDPVPSACGTDSDTTAPAEPVIEEEPVASELEIIPPGTEEQTEQTPVEEDSLEPAAEELPEEELSAEEVLPDLEILPPIEIDSLEPDIDPGEDATASEETSGGWLWLIAAALLIAAGLVLHFLRKRRVQSTSGPAETIQPSVEPETGDEAAWSPPPADSRLSLQGLLADGGPFEIGCDISAEAINLVIGRGEVDLKIDSAAVSRQHARLNGTAGLLTLADLGSNNGSAINGVPCLEGEIMYVEPGDTVTLGDVRFTIDIKPRAGD